LPPYDPTANGEVPMIRPGDTLAVDALKAAGVDWALFIAMAVLTGKDMIAW